MGERLKNHFLELVYLGQTEWYRYFFRLVLVLFFWLVLGSVFVLVPIVWVMIDGNPDTAVNMQTGFVTGVDPILNYITLNLAC